MNLYVFTLTNDREILAKEPLQISNLTEKVFDSDKTNDLFRNLDRLRYTTHETFQAEAMLLDLLMQSSGVLSEDRQAEVADGIREMFGNMKENVFIVSAPLDEQERRQFYVRLTKGFRYIAQLLHEDAVAGDISTAELANCLEVIGDGGYACAGRWRQVLEAMINDYREKIQQRNDLAFDAPTNQKEKLESALKQLFFKARVIEGNKLSESFMQEFYRRVGTESRLHYYNFFQRYLNATSRLNLPLIEEYDTYVNRYAEQIQDHAESFCANLDFEKIVTERAKILIKEKISESSELYNALIDWANRYYLKLPVAIQKRYDGYTDFLQDVIFEGYSTKISEEGLGILLADKGFFIPEGILLQTGTFHRLYDFFATCHSATDKESLNYHVFVDSDEEEAAVKLILSQGKHPLKFWKLALETQNQGLLAKLQQWRIPVDFNADVNEKGESLLHLAAKHATYPVILYMIDHGANRFRQDFFGNLAIQKAEAFENWDALSAFTESGQFLPGKSDLPIRHHLPDRPNTNMRLQTSLLLKHIRTGCVSEVEKLLDDSLIDSQDMYGNTPLHEAAKNNQLEIAKFLLEKGADPDRLNNGGNTPDALARSLGHQDMFRFLEAEKSKQHQDRLAHFQQNMPELG